jgi:hypothetical protein
MSVPNGRIIIPPYDERSREAGAVWTLRKDGHVATCHLWTPPYGGEVRLRLTASGTGAKGAGMARTRCCVFVKRASARLFRGESRRLGCRTQYGHNHARFGHDRQAKAVAQVIQWAGFVNSRMTLPSGGT